MNLTTCLHLPGYRAETDGPLAVILRELFAESMAHALHPRPLPVTGLERIALYLNSKLSALLSVAVDRWEKPAHQIFAELASAAWAQRHGGTNPASNAVPPSNEHQWNAERERHQRAIVNLVITAAGSPAGGNGRRKIALIEAGTGIGKSRAICMSAARLLKEPRIDCIVVSAPTVAVLSHLLSEWGAVPECAGIPKCIVLGRRQFVSEHRLASYLHALSTEVDRIPPEEWTAAERWLQLKGPIVAPSTMALAKGAPHLCWMADDLATVAPSLDLDAVVLDGAEEDDESEALGVYEGLRERAGGGTGVIFCTHAMLCTDLRAKSLARGILPEYRAILVDEGHELEPTMASMYGGQLSFNMLRHELRTGEWGKLHLGEACREAIKLTEAVIARLSSESMAATSYKHSSLGPEDRSLIDSLKPLAELLSKFRTVHDKKKNRSNLPPGLKRISYWSRILDRAVGNDDDDADGVVNRERVWVTHSPSRRVPSITVGPVTLKKPFAALWESIITGALFSGTLYAEDQFGNCTAEYTRSAIWLPKNRSLEHVPIAASWAYFTPTLFTPSEAKAKRLAYPGQEPAALYDQWIAAIAAELLTIADKARAGTLALCNSCEDISRLGVKLESLEGRLLVQRQGGKGVAGLAADFRARAEESARPVWLATGPAWTGLDLRGREEKPENDFVLTDLVIIRIPFGQERSSTHLARVSARGFLTEIRAATLRLKQGCGRLIRRPGVSDRRMWLLDGRIHDKQMPHVRNVCEFLYRYQRREEL